MNKNENKVPFLCDRCGLMYYPIGSKFCNQCGAELKPYVQEVFDKHVLLVDDSLLSRTKIRAILKKLGCKVTEAGDGVEALEKAIALNPDAIVMDVEMPKKDGLETLAALRTDPRFKRISIAMLTAHSDAEFVSKALAYHVNDYIRKDAPIEELQERFKKLLSR